MSRLLQVPDGGKNASLKESKGIPQRAEGKVLEIQEISVPFRIF